MHSQQMILPLVPTSLKRFELFYPGQNALCLNTLKQEELPPFTYIYGTPGSGKTHLLEACAFAAIQAKKRVLFLPLRHLTPSAECFQDLHLIDLLLIDDIEYLPKILETPMFHCFNALQEQRIPLLMSSRLKPSLLQIKLADLKSRLQSGLSLKLIPLKDEELRAALILYAETLNLFLDPKLYDWLLRHLSRDLNALTNQIKIIAEYSLIAKKPVTLPLIKQVLALTDTGN